MTTERSSSVDFVSPFLELSGISVVLRKPEFRASMTKFLSVLKAEVWLALGAAVACVGALLWVMERFTPLGEDEKPVLE